MPSSRRRSPRRGTPPSGRASSTRAKPSRCCSPGESRRRPVGLLVEPVDEVRQLHLAQHGRGPVVGEGVGRGRVGQGGAQVAQRDVGLLGRGRTRRRPSGRRTVPSANGQRSARLRSRVVLPLPDRPVTRSAVARREVAGRGRRPAAGRRAAGRSGRRTSSPSPSSRLDRRERARLGVGVEEAVEADEGGAVGREVVVGAAGRTTARSAPGRTRCAVCWMSPRLIWPAKNRGAWMTSGMICEYWVITTLKPLNFRVRKTMAHALSMTARNRRGQDAALHVLAPVTSRRSRSCPAAGRARSGTRR